MAYRSGIILQLGAITAIVDIDNAVASKVSLKNVCIGHPKDPDPAKEHHAPTALKQSPLKCPACDNDNPEDMRKASVVGKEFTVIEKSEVNEAKTGAVGAAAKVISLLAHPADEVHTQTVQQGSVYQLKAANQPMVPVVSLIWDTISRHPELAFVGHFAPAGRVNLYEVRLYGDTLILVQLARTEDLKIVQQPLAPINPAYQKQVDLILAAAQVPYDVAAFQDDYLKRLTDILATKTAEAGVLVAKSTGTATVPAGSVDLSAMLGLS